MVLEALVWVDDSRWSPESKGPSTVHSRHTGHPTGRQEWVGSCPLVFAYMTFLAFPAVIRSQGGVFIE